MKSGNKKLGQLKKNSEDNSTKPSSKKERREKLKALAAAGNVKAQKQLAKLKKAARAKKRLAADAEVEKQAQAVAELATIPTSSGLRERLGLAARPPLVAAPVATAVAVSRKSAVAVDADDILDDEDTITDTVAVTSADGSENSGAVVAERVVEVAPAPATVDLHPWPFTKQRKGVILRTEWNALVESIQDASHHDAYAECEDLHQTIAELLDANDAMKKRMAEMQEQVNKFMRGFDAAFN